MDLVSSLSIPMTPARSDVAARPGRPASERDVRVEETGALSFSGVLQRQQEQPLIANPGGSGRESKSAPTEEGDTSPGAAQAGPSAPTSTAGAPPPEAGNPSGNPLMIGQMVRILMGQEGAQATPDAAAATVAGDKSSVDLQPTAGQSETSAKIDLEKLATVLQQPKATGNSPLAVAATRAAGNLAVEGTAEAADQISAQPLAGEGDTSENKPLLEIKAQGGSRPLVDASLQAGAKLQVESKPMAAAQLQAQSHAQPAPQLQSVAPETMDPAASSSTSGLAGMGLQTPNPATGVNDSTADTRTFEQAGDVNLEEVSAAGDAAAAATAQGEGLPENGTEGQSKPAEAQPTVTSQAESAATPVAAPTSQPTESHPVPGHKSETVEAAPTAPTASGAEAASSSQRFQSQVLDALGNARPGAAETSHQIRSQVVRELAASLDGGIGNEKITLHLNPEKLGQVEIQFTARGNDLNVVITATGREAEHALREGIKELAEGIADKSMRWQQVDIKVEQRSQDQEKNDSRQDGRKDQSRREGKQDQGQHHQQQDHKPGAGPDWSSLRGEG